jgi:hypothetical protein
MPCSAVREWQGFREKFRFNHLNIVKDTAIFFFTKSHKHPPDSKVLYFGIPQYVSYTDIQLISRSQ